MWRKFLMALVMITLLPGSVMATPAQFLPEMDHQPAAHAHHDGHTLASQEEESCCHTIDGQEQSACQGYCDAGACHCACQLAALAVINPLVSFAHPGRVPVTQLPVTVPAIAPLPPERPPRTA
jgi:hypothetical protein